MMNTSLKKDKQDIKLKKPRLFRSQEYKLKDKIGRNRVIVDFKKHIGFYPVVLAVRKVSGKNNVIVFEFTVPDGFNIKKKQEELRVKKDENKKI